MHNRIGIKYFPFRGARIIINVAKSGENAEQTLARRRAIRYNDHRIARTINDSIVLAAKRLVLPQMIL